MKKFPFRDSYRRCMSDKTVSMLAVYIHAATMESTYQVKSMIKNNHFSVFFNFLNIFYFERKFLVLLLGIILIIFLRNRFGWTMIFLRGSSCSSDDIRIIFDNYFFFVVIVLKCSPVILFQTTSDDRNFCGDTDHR